MDRRELYERLRTENVPLRKAVKMLRESIGKTQVEYAALCKVNLKALRALEQGRNTTLDTIERILAPFGGVICVKPSSNVSRED